MIEDALLILGASLVFRFCEFSLRSRTIPFLYLDEVPCFFLQKSGLSGWIGDQLRFVDELHPVLTITLYTASVTICTQLISNNATTLLLLPISESVVCILL